MVTFYVKHVRNKDNQLVVPAVIDISKLHQIKEGDLIVMKRGELVGTYSNKWSEFSEDGLHSLAAANKILKFKAALYYKQSGGPNGISTKVEVYGTRKLVNRKGNRTEQALIKYMGSPVWINLPANTVLWKNKKFH